MNRLEPYKYHIDIEKKIIIETFNGEMTVQKYKELKEREFADPDFDSSFSVIADLRLITIHYNEKKLLRLVEFLVENKTNIGQRKSALVATKPIQVAASVMFNQLAQELPFHIKIFNTFEGALHWVSK